MSLNENLKLEIDKKSLSKLLVSVDSSPLGHSATWEFGLTKFSATVFNKDGIVILSVSADKLYLTDAEYYKKVTAFQVILEAINKDIRSYQ